MLQATEVLKDKFWIVSTKYGKVGTLRKHEDVYVFFDQRDNTTTELDDLKELFKVKQSNNEPGEIQTYQGFFTGVENPIGVDDQKSDLPLFKKSQNSKTIFCAGYYIVKFQGMGWQYVTTPKFSTLCKYIYKGPYMTEWEMNEDLKKHKRRTSYEDTKSGNSGYN